MDLEGDVMEEIVQKYKNMQKGIGGMMRGALIEISARTILNQGKRQGNNWSVRLFSCFLYVFKCFFGQFNI